MRMRSINPLGLALILSCGGGATGSEQTLTTPSSPSAFPPIQVVVFTHIEDQTPGGVLGTAMNRTSYLSTRASMLQMAALMNRYGMKWSLQPDWKILLAALEYEDASTRASTAGLNLFRYLRDSAKVAIDPHSHEAQGYNYTDVYHLLDSLGVGGSTIIGGHVWDPSVPQFAEWDRFRVPVRGLKYPNAIWRGDVLMGSGSPNHVNDPIVSGVWRPKNRNEYFVDDPAGNIACVGAYKGDIATISELVARYRSGAAPATCMQTATVGVSPSEISAVGGLAAIENTIVKPLAALRDSNQVKLTDFTALVATWRQEFGARSCTYRLSP